MGQIGKERITGERHDDWKVTVSPHSDGAYVHAENYLNLVSPGQIAWLYNGSSSAAGGPLDAVVDHLLRVVLKSSYL